MKHVKVADLMTDEVVSVVPGTSFKEVAKLLAQHDISGVPVLDEEDRVIGVVSHTDLLARAATEPSGSSYAGEPGHAPYAPEPDAAAAARDGSWPQATTAGGVMSAPAITVHADEPAADAARLMTRRGVERLPVVDVEDRLVGIVTRRDLLRLFLRPDAEIRRRVEDDVLTDVLGMPAGALDVHVVDGIVTLAGLLDRQSRLPVLHHLVERIDGVVAVISHVTARTDDTQAPTPHRHAMPW